MKKYIIFANSISGIGGGQLYILRKLKYLSNNGYDAYLIVGDANSIEHKELQQFKTLEMPQIYYPPNLYNHKKRNKSTLIMKQFISYNDTDKIYIESHQTAPALWGELFAERVNSINTIYALAPFGVERKVYKDFFNEKLNKEQFLGCNKSFVKTNFPQSNAQDNYANIPFDKEEIITLDCAEVQDNTFDLNILTISRIDKTYIKNSILELIEYSSRNNKIKIKYDIYIDVTFGEKYDELKSIIDSNKQENLTINLLEPVYPLNNCLYNNQDLFIGMGTAILNSASMKLASLVVDYRNNKYYGFFGQDHHEFGDIEEQADNNLDSYIDSLIKDKDEKDILGEKAYTLFCLEFENKVVNNKFIDFIEKSFNEKDTYTQIPTRIFDARDLLDFILINIFGAKRSLTIRKSIVNVLNKGKNHI